MKTVGKGLLYLLLLVVAVVCFGRFRAEFASSNAGSRRFDAAEVTPPDAGGGTNAADRVAQAAEGSTNSAATSPTNAVAGAADAVSSPTNQPGPGAPVVPAGTTAGQPARSRSGGYLAGFVGALLALAVLIGWDITQWFATRATQGLGVDLKPIENDPEYDAAEAEWAKGNHLDAIQLLRDYLKRNPSQQHAAIRISEIYEKDLHNYIAAALELEEVLTKRLPREKWGWTAIHLANIYSGRLNQADKAISTLERIVNNYSETAAAKKARQRLGLPDPVAEAAVAEAGSEELAESEPENPNVPKGFKPKKR